MNVVVDGVMGVVHAWKISCVCVCMNAYVCASARRYFGVDSVLSASTLARNHTRSQSTSSHAHTHDRHSRVPAKASGTRYSGMMPCERHSGCLCSLVNPNNVRLDRVSLHA